MGQMLSLCGESQHLSPWPWPKDGILLTDRMKMKDEEERGSIPDWHRSLDAAGIQPVKGARVHRKQVITASPSEASEH